jgi:LPXTG-motif cell wall-anchored protein
MLRVFTVWEVPEIMISKKYIAFPILFLAIALVAVPAGAMTNPSAGYCLALGYQYTDVTGADGSMTGYCLLPGNQTVDAWQFLQGTAAPELSYCKKQGLDIRTVNDSAVCGMLGTPCAVCVKADGTTQEVTKMMGLDFREKICSGNICCDPAKDKTCVIGQESPSTGSSDGLLIVIIAVIAVIIIAGIAYFLMKKKKGSEPEKKNP